MNNKVCYTASSFSFTSKSIMLKKFKCFFYLFICLFLSSCALKQPTTTTSDAECMKQAASKEQYCVYGKQYSVLKSSKHYEAKGIASWYGRRFNHKHTSSGERYNMYQYTAAHKTLPFATRLLVTNLKNGKQVIVRVNDRGPFVGNRLIDLSYAAAKKIGLTGQGLANVKIKAISKTTRLALHTTKKHPVKHRSRSKHLA